MAKAKLKRLGNGTAIALETQVLANSENPVMSKAIATYVSSIIAALPKGIILRGAIDYASELPEDPEIGDAYTVLYKGTEGTEPDGSEYVWVKYNEVPQWIKLGSDEGGSGLPDPEASGALLITDEEDDELVWKQAAGDTEGDGADMLVTYKDENGVQRIKWAKVEDLRRTGEAYVSPVYGQNYKLATQIAPGTVCPVYGQNYVNDSEYHS